MERTHILLVEDNEGDILLTKEALEEKLIIHDLSVVRDGSEAIRFMLKAGEFTKQKTPDLVILDINLPKKSGHEVLEFIKTNDDLRHIPVVMLTTSSSPVDIKRAYRNYANCFITKPVDSEDFLNTILFMGSFWLDVVSMPPKRD